jgi:GT2 family glycosyltransferase
MKVEQFYKVQAPDPARRDNTGSMADVPTVAVLCVTHGRPELVRKCIRSCAAQDYPSFEIVTVINPADESSEKAVREEAPGVKIIRTHRNIGFFPALNLALANTDSEYVMIVDDDAWFLSDNALSNLVEEFRRDSELGAVTCNLEGPYETPITGGDQFIRAFTTGFTFMPRKVVTNWVGYFPDSFFRSAGETFLCTSLWDQRRPVKRVERVRMYHALASQGRSARDWRFYGLRSQILCSVMREPAFWIIPVLVSKFVKSFVLSLKTKDLLVWLHAWSSSLLNLSEAMRFRFPISHKTRLLLARLDSAAIRDLSECPEWESVGSHGRKWVR